jgi:hypothetical protein
VITADSKPLEMAESLEIKNAASRIALTYANDKLEDGAGAQLQRIYGIYALARYLDLPYIHSPIRSLGYQGLAALEANSPVADLHLAYNRVFSIPPDVALPEDAVVHEMRDVNIEALDKLIAAQRDPDRFQVLRILFPYGVTDRIPEIYRWVQPICPFQKQASEVFRIAIHVRRGEHIAISSKRMLPNSYFVAVAMQLTTILAKLGEPFACELFTEVPSKSFVVTPDHHGIKGRIARPITVDPSMNHLEDFDSIPNLSRSVNLDPIETLRRMSTADALIMSRSSFSYLAALFNADGIVIYHPFWHSPLADWVICNAAIIPEDAVIEGVIRWRSANASVDGG